MRSRIGFVVSAISAVIILVFFATSCRNYTVAGRWYLSSGDQVVAISNMNDDEIAIQRGALEEAKNGGYDTVTEIRTRRALDTSWDFGSCDGNPPLRYTIWYLLSKEK